MFKVEETLEFFGRRAGEVYGWWEGGGGGLCYTAVVPRFTFSMNRLKSSSAPVIFACR